MAGRGAENQAQLAKALGVAPKQISKYLRDPRWGFGKAPWDAAAVEKIRAWRQLKLSPNPAASSLPRPLPPAEGVTPPGVTPGPSPCALPSPPPSPFGPGDEDDRVSGSAEGVNIWLKTERAKFLKLQREVEEGKYLLRADVEQGRLQRIHAVKAALSQLPRLAEKLVGMSAEQIGLVLEGEVEKILHGFARDDDARA